MISASTTASHSKIGKILIAEDDPEAREFLMSVLGGDYTLLQAADGMEALDIARAERPDLLITDVVMPRMDGHELVRRLRQEDDHTSLQVIFCSASYHEHAVQTLALALGVTGTLAKPYNGQAVRAVVTQALQRSVLESASFKADAQRAPQAARFAQDRLDALVGFTRCLFTQTTGAAIVEAGCRAARDILLSQCAHIEIRNDADELHRAVESGLTAEALQRLLSAERCVALAASAAGGAVARFPTDPAMLNYRDPPQSSDDPLMSMLAVPIATGSRCYGHLSVLNRIGMNGFTEEDVAVARALAAQVAIAWENLQRHQALEHEVAQRTLAETEVRRLNRELEQRVLERTAEARILHREIEALSYSVAHDLRSPLRLINAHEQMLRECLGENAPAEIIAHIDHIQRGAGHMSRLIDALLMLLRVSHMEMQQESTALDALVERVIEEIEPQLQGRAIDWRIAALPTVVCDPELMRQAFTHLLGNAVKYTRSRTPACIDVGVGTRDQQTYLYVRDNGVGFDMRYASKLFGIFQRLHHHNEFEGTGIGLATVSRIIERHGGRIWAEAAIGQGAVLRFTLAGLAHR